jgi:hypothetical protein
MFELPLAYINQADREREVDADLRRRQILKPPPSSIERSGAGSVRVANPPAQAHRVRAAER